MALYRPPIQCVNCGHQNGFKHQPITEMQRLMGWVGDNGGKYPTICESCYKPIMMPEGLIGQLSQEEIDKLVNR